MVVCNINISVYKKASEARKTLRIVWQRCFVRMDAYIPR